MVDVTADRFEAEVLQRSHEVPVVVDFWAPWCGPCTVLGPILERLAEEAGGSWELVKVNVDHAHSLAARYGISGIPAVKAFRDGEVVAQFTGALPHSRVVDWLSGVVPSEVDLAVRAAGELEGAERTAALEQALALDPRHAGARLALAEQLLSDDPDRASELLDGVRDPRHAQQVDRLRILLDAGGADVSELRSRLEADPLDHQARYDLAHALAADGDYDGALAELLQIVRVSRQWRDDAARLAMLRIFEAIGARSPTSDTWRDQLAKVLY